MPRRKRKYERKTTVFRKRKRAKVKRRRAIPRGLFAKTTKMAFRYVDTLEINADSGANFVYHTLSANSMWNPDVTTIISDHKPYGFNEYMQFYNHYTVIGCMLRVEFIPQGYATDTPTSNGRQYVGVMQTAGATPGILSINTVLESKRTNTKISQLISGNRGTVITSKVALSKAFGQKVLQEDNNAGTATSSPAEQWYFQIMAATTNVAVEDPKPLRFKIQMDFIAILHEPKDVAGS